MTNPSMTTTAGDLRDSPEARRAVAMHLVQRHKIAVQQRRLSIPPARRMKKTGFRWYWLAWFLLAVAGFAIPELVVIADGRMDLTLSDTVDALAHRFRWFGWGVAALLAILSAVMVVLGMHFHLFA